MRNRYWASLAVTALVTAVGVVGVASPAPAAVPDSFGFAVFSGGIVSQQFPPATTVVSAGVPGRWIVTFPGMGIAGGVAHVTAIHDALANPPGRWCQLDGWAVSGVNEIVGVSCYSPFGALAPQVGFSVMFTRSSGPLGGGGVYGYLDSTPAGAIITQYNSALLGNTVFHAGPGQYSIAFTGMATAAPNEGGLQVTAVNPGVGARCKVASWQSSPNGQFARIFCFNPGGGFADTRFTASFQAKRALWGGLPTRYGYLWNVPPLGPPPTNVNSIVGSNGIVFGPPVWTVSMPMLATTQPGNGQVTAFGTTSDFCGMHQPPITSGTTIFVRINCFNNAGAVASSGFLQSFSSRI